MTVNESTRRGYLARMGSAGVGVLLPGLRDADLGSQGDGTALSGSAGAADVRGLDPATLVITDGDAPSDLRVLEADTTAPFLAHLRDIEPRFADARTALSGYWTGADPRNPRSVLASLACVCDHQLDADAVVTAARRCHNDLAATYVDTLSPAVRVSQAEQVGATHGTWQVDLVGASAAAEATAPDSPVAGDLLQLQYGEHLILGTVVFGPRQGGTDLEARLQRFAALQRRKLRAQVDARVQRGDASG